MVRVRSLLWLLALVAFAVSSFGTASVAHAAAEQPAMADCPDHAPPPDCPSQGTAKHAAGNCCPLMMGVVALLPGVTAGQKTVPHHLRPTIARDLIGLTFTQDPPPPRV